MWTVIFGLIGIGLLVVVHELGHFVVARLFGIGTPVFSVGMGPRLFGFRAWDTDIRISALPIGGYVQLAGADPFGEEDVDSGVPPEEDFSKRPAWQKLLVMAAGPGVNLLLPIALFTGLLMAGRPEVAGEVGEVLPDTPAAAAGLRSGDRILSIDGEPVEVWMDVSSSLERHLGTKDEVPVAVEREGARVETTLATDALVAGSIRGIDSYRLGALPYHWSSAVGVPDPDSAAAKAGVQTGDDIVAVDGEDVGTWEALHAALEGDDPHVLTVERPDAEVPARGARRTTHQVTILLPPRSEITPAPVHTPFDDAWGLVPLAGFIGTVQPGSPAEAVGLKPGDRVLALNGRPIWSFDHLIAEVGRVHEGSDTPREMELTLQRGHDEEVLRVVPEMRVVSGEPYRRPIMGIQSHPGIAVSVGQASRHYGLFEAVPLAVDETGLLVHATMSLMANLFVGEADVGESVGGPVAIVTVAGRTAERGLFAYFGLLGMLSISLGLMNLLPIPVLDGGQILFHLIEGVRGRPLSAELRERVQILGVMFLVVTFLYVTVNDLSRLAGPT